jgi:hypothetical protein
MPIIRANKPVVLKMISFLNTKKAMPLIIGISDEIKGFSAINIKVESHIFG